MTESHVYSDKKLVRVVRKMMLWELFKEGSAPLDHNIQVYNIGPAVSETMELAKAMLGEPTTNVRVSMKPQIAHVREFEDSAHVPILVRAQ